MRHRSQYGNQTIRQAQPSLPEEQQHQEAEPNEAAKDDGIAPLLGPNLPDQIVHSGHLASCADDTSVDAGHSFPLQAEVLVDSVGLAENTVHHIVAVFHPPPLFQHVVRLGCTWV